MANNQDNPGINVPPTLIYVVRLILALLLDTSAHLPFLPPGAMPRVAAHRGRGSDAWVCS